MTDHQHYRAPYGRSGPAPLPYAIARKIAEMSLFARMAQLMMGPRVIAALLDEIDASNRQVADLGVIVSDLTDMLANAGDGMIAVNRERNLARDAAAVATEVARQSAAEAQRLRDRLVAQHPGAQS